MIRKIFPLIKFSLFYIKEVIKTNVIVAVEVLTPTHYMKPAFVKVDVGGLTDQQLLIFCNLLTMTPGSMVVDVSEDKHTVTVHVLYLDDENKSIREIEENYLNRVKELF
jgi:multicomponent Na+:H+ antiporter subunit E